MTKEMIEELATRFGTTAERLIPAMQQYELRMNKIGFATLMALIILVLLIGLAFILIGKPYDPGFVAAPLVMAEMVLIALAIIIAVDYIGWKYHPEMKFLKYVIGR